MDHPSILLSVGLPVYNGEEYIQKALDSLLGQTFTNFELIISDNASTDRTAEICQEYVARDPRVRYIRNPENLGAAQNYNQVFKMGIGKYFKWSAADDVCAPTFFERCLAPMEQDPNIVLAFPNTIFIDENGNTSGEHPEVLHLMEGEANVRYQKFHERLRKREKCNPIFGVIRSSVLAQTRLIDTFTSSDMVLLSELALLGKFFEVPDYLFYRRDHPGMSIRAYERRDRAQWFDPKLKGKNIYPYWRLWKEFIRSVWHISLPFPIRGKALVEVMRWAYWRRLLLWRELIVFVQQLSFHMPRYIQISLRYLWRVATALSRVFRKDRSLPTNKSRTP